MFKNLSLGVQEIQGIGPQTEAVLSTHNIYTLLDFIAEPVSNLEEKLDELASEKEIKQWHLMALFMQIDAVKGQFAEALVEEGIKSISEIAFMSVEDLQNLFENATNARMIPKIPEEETIFEMIREATILTFSQTYLGRLTDEEGLAVENAKVKVYYQSTTTNANGYFRLFGLVSPEDKMLVWTENRHYQFEGYPISRYADNIEVETLVLNSESEIAQVHLSEYAGDKLPPTGSYPILTDTQKVEKLRKGDIFLVRSIKPERNEIVLQSIYNEFNGLEFKVRLLRFSSEGLDASIKEREYVKEFFGTLRKLKGDRSMVKFWKLIRKSQMGSSTTNSEEKTIKIN